MSDPESPLTPAAFREATGVSRETLDRLSLYLDTLVAWQKAMNLVGASTLTDPWRRHMLDSAQLLPLIPVDTKTLLDLGSGAGFPGAVLAIMGAEGVNLVESDQKKASFLREVSRKTGARMTIHPVRLERLAPFPAGVITARAFASVDKILNISSPFRGRSCRYLLLKGESAEAELTEAKKGWSMAATAIRSRSSATGTVLVMEGVERHDRSR